ncbi:hypothetical protein ACLB2K_039192 [Fragaria x ananassa]
MGNSMTCFSPARTAPKKLSTNLSRRPSKRSPYSSPFFGSSASRTKGSPNKVQTLEDDLILQQQAIEAVLMFQNHQKNSGSLPQTFNRSTSVVFPAPSGPKKNQGFTKSSSSRQPLGSDTLFQPLELVDKQDVKIEGLETNHFVLVHGGGFGAWCWYKTMTLLEESGFKVDAVDLTGSGIHSFDTNSITSLAQYVKPLTEILENLDEGKKVILVGHDFGGTCISYAMELFPSKIAKAIFISAAMLTSGQSTLNLFAQQTSSNDLMRQAQVFLYANGKDQPPTAIGLGKKFTEDLLFNQSPAKDVALASVSMRPIPFAPVTEKLSLSDKKYGSVRRFFIVTQEDHAISVTLQEAMLESNPPEQFYRLKGSDHAPFFSRPQALHRILVEISQSEEEYASSRGLMPQWHNVLSQSIRRIQAFPSQISSQPPPDSLKNMGRGVSSGGGQSSLDYLFGSGGDPKPRTNNVQAAPKEVQAVNEPTPKPTASPPPPKPEPVDITKQIPAGIHSTSTNNYMRADGQNTGNFITDRPSTKVHSAPGGGSSLGYLFGGPAGN